MNTSGHVHDDFVRLFSSQTHWETSILPGELPWETSILPGELPEETDQFRFLRVEGLVNLKESLELILDETSVMRVTIPIDLSTRSFNPLPLLNPSPVIFPQQSD